MRNWLALFEGTAPSDELLDLLEDWMLVYDAGATWGGDKNDLCRRIIDLAKDHPPRLDGPLYRGTGIPDDIAIALAQGQTVTLPVTEQLLVSWTTHKGVAENFCADAAETKNFSAAVIRLPVSRLTPIIDMRILYDARINTGDEDEVLVLAEPITLTPADLTELWVYDDDRGSSVEVPLDGKYMPPPPKMKPIRDERQDAIDYVVMVANQYPKTYSSDRRSAHVKRLTALGLSGSDIENILPPATK